MMGFVPEGSDLDYAVMIVGGGPAGISTWMHLHKEAPELAAQSIVIEKAVFPRQKVCAGGLCIRAVFMLTNLRAGSRYPVPVCI